MDRPVLSIILIGRSPGKRRSGEKSAMADSEPKAQAEKELQVVYDQDDRSLKYLEFVELAAAYAAICFHGLYEFSKENAGPLRPGVQNVEDTVRAVIAPVSDKFRDVPLELLRYIDHKIDEYVHELEKHTPSLLKQVSGHTWAIAAEARRAGFVDGVTGFAKSMFDTYEPVAKELFVRYEPVAEQCAVWAWRHLNQLPMFPEVAHIVVPPAAYWAKRYNEGVMHGADKGYAALGYLPLIPIDKIVQLLELAEHRPGVAPMSGQVPALAQ